MKLSRAIEVLQLELNEPGSVSIDDFDEAQRLSIEALKEYQKLKLTTFLPIGYKLPGETEV